jgi:phosphatidylglycerophosphate synthase
MFDEPVRQRFGRLAQPVIAVAAAAGVTPNQVTLLTFLIALTGAGFLACGWARVGLAIWLVSRLGDGLDGALARATGRRTPFGAYLDITLDMAAYSAMVLAFARLYPAQELVWSAILAAYVLVITTTLALSDAATSVDRRISPTDRTFQFTPGIAEAGETSVMYCLWVMFPDHVGWLAWIWLAALMATCVQRSRLAWRVLR